jgi:hypothetical protein
MLATPQGNRYQTFHDASMRAITNGEIPSRSCDLDHTTRSLIELIADRHPEANPDLIGDAFEAFDRARHGAEPVGEETPIC